MITEIFKKYNLQLTFIIAVLGLILPSYIAYDIFQKSTRVADLKVNQLWGYDELSRLDDDLRKKVELRIDNKLIDSFYVFTFQVENRGNVAITPSDFIEPITVTVNKNWRIFYVKEILLSQPFGLSLNWDRISDQRYRMRPILFNPGDMIWFQCYVVSNTQKNEQKKETPVLSWSGRIVNVENIISNKAKELQPHTPLRYLYTFIRLQGIEVYAFILVSMVLFVSAIQIAKHAERLTIGGVGNVVLISIIMFFSMSTGEIIVFLFSKSLLAPWPGIWYLIILHILLFFYISWPILKRRTQH